jgi:hypothetical protein
VFEGNMVSDERLGIEDIVDATKRAGAKDMIED